MTRRLHVTWGSSRYQVNAVDGIRVRVEVDEAEDVSTKIFAYLVEPLSPTLATERAIFDHVCSPVDLEDFPEDTPVESQEPAWFRLNYVDIVVRSATEAQAAVEDILEDIRSLKTSLDVIDTLQPADYGTESWMSGEVWIDEAADSSSSSSEAE